MAMSNAEKFIALGMPSELAKVVADAIDNATPGIITVSQITDFDTGVSAAVAAKTEIAALDSESLAADIVAALQA